MVVRHHATGQLNEALPTSTDGAEQPGTGIGGTRSGTRSRACTTQSSQAFFVVSGPAAGHLRSGGVELGGSTTRPPSCREAGRGSRMYVALRLRR